MKIHFSTHRRFWWKSPIGHPPPFALFWLSADGLTWLVEQSSISARTGETVVIFFFFFMKTCLQLSWRNAWWCAKQNFWGSRCTLGSISTSWCKFFKVENNSLELTRIFKENILTKWEREKRRRREIEKQRERKRDVSVSTPSSWCKCRSIDDVTLQEIGPRVLGGKLGAGFQRQVTEILCSTCPYKKRE